MTDPLTEAVARALAKAKGIEICSDATYSQSSFRAPALAAIAAMREQLVPVAWMYSHWGHPKNRTPTSVGFTRVEGPLGEGWTETPIYAFPAAPTEGEG